MVIEALASDSLVNSDVVQGSRDRPSELADEILIKVQRHLGGGWSHIEAKDLIIRRISGGYLNTVFAVERASKGTTEDTSSPSRVLYRKYGGTNLSSFLRNQGVHQMNSEAQETLIFYESGKTGRAPQLLAVFDGGRIEEFIDGHTILCKELSQPNILKGLAEAFAAFHALKLPLPDHSDIITDQLTEEVAPETISTMRSELSVSHPNVVLDFLDYDYDEPRQWILRNMQHLKTRVVFGHYDNNLLNVMVRDTPVTGQKEILLIDYEMSKYMFRFFDLGAFFVNKTIKWDGIITKKSGSSYPTLEERQIFLQHYCNEIAKHSFPDFDKDGLDSLDHVTLEAHFGAICLCVFMSCKFVRLATQMADIEESFLTLNPHLYQLQRDLRSEFYRSHPDFC